MLRNYLLTAWRNILKNKLYASINIVGLVVGLAVYIFGSLLATYERSHDGFFENADRIFTAGSVISATANLGIAETDGVYSALAPFIKSDVPEIEAVARTVRQEFLLTIGEDSYYQNIRFADPELLTIFDFDYIEGDNRALDDPMGLLLTESMAKKLFGDGPALGKSLTLDHDNSLHVSAVIQDLPLNTHFNSSLIQTTSLDVVAPLAALKAADDYDLEGNWSNLSMGDMTYMLLPEDKPLSWLQSKLDGLYESHYPEDQREMVTGFHVRSLSEANTMIWDAVGMPVIESIQLLGLLVLIVAIVNYTNLATAQSLGRAREVGLRKTMGADRRQLLTQFLVESLAIVCISTLIALASLEVLIPAFNNALDKALVIDYAVTLPWLALTTIVVGLVAGAYPAHLITQTTPIEALRDGGGRSAKGGIFRSVMLGLQFTISVFMLAMVMVVYFQNAKIENSSNLYPKSQILTLKRLDVESIQSRLETLRTELKAIPGVEQIAYSSQVPFEQSNSSTSAGTVQGDETQSIMLNQVVIDQHFMKTYNIPLLAGREFTTDISEDSLVEGVNSLNVIVNELALSKFGIRSAQDAIGKVFYDFPTTREPRIYTIIGVMPDQNFLGLHNKIKPMMFFINPEYHRIGSIRITGKDMKAAIAQVEEVWKELIPDYPIQTEFLDEVFGQVFQIYSGMTKVLAGFAVMALTLSMIGLFGLAAFMAASRTKEIGIRKVMGASLPEIVRMLIWQFSKPVIWALVIALPMAYFASSIYLDFFADRLELPAGIVLAAGIASVAFAWGIVAIHAIKIARSNPIHALCYE
jgi:putative ABC transport system permease protein